MEKTFPFILIAAGFIFLFNVANFATPFQKVIIQPKNSAPVVKILSPKNNSTITFGTQVPYSIMVSDKEDGDSKYDEINTKEVLLEVKYFDDTTGLYESFKRSGQQDPAGLALIRTSNCLNCHAFDHKLIGPGFNEIRKRYQPASANFALLEKRIHEGSTGIWGKATMPSHPELSKGQIQIMVKWIMDKVENSQHFYVGTEGLLKVPSDVKLTALLLTASYTDHGINNAGIRLNGKDAVIIWMKK